MDSCDHIPLELPLGEAAVEIQVLGGLQSLWWCWQEPPVGQEGARTQEQWQELILVLEQG